MTDVVALSPTRIARAEARQTGATFDDPNPTFGGAA